MSANTINQSILEAKLEINALLEFVENNANHLDEYQMETEIKMWLNKFGLIALKHYFAVRGTGDVGEQLTLEDGTILNKESRLHERNLFSIFGKLTISRTCYRINGEPGIMPLDAQVNLPDKSYSYLLQEYMDILNIREPFGQSSEILEKFLCFKIHPSRFEAVSRTSCTSFDQFYGGQKAPDPQSEGAILVAGFDGKGVPLIKSEAAKIKARKGKGEKRQKKKEAIVGVSYSIDKHIRTAQQVAKNLVYPEKNKNHEKAVDKPKAKNIRRLASLERPKEEVFHEIMNHSRARDRENKKPLVVVMDGALSLWSILMTFMQDIPFTGILDIIHVTEYLWKVANTVYKEGTELGRKWVYNNLLAILEGDVDGVIDNLKSMLKIKRLNKNRRDTINECIRYFTNHRKWMKYNEYIEAGYPIGSGVVESTCGHTVKNRMEGTGRRWSIEGAEAILLLRSIFTSQDWQEYWEFHMELERSFYYHDAMVAVGFTDRFNELGIIEKNIDISAVAA